MLGSGLWGDAGTVKVDDDWLEAMRSMVGMEVDHAMSDGVVEVETGPVSDRKRVSASTETDTASEATVDIA